MTDAAATLTAAAAHGSRRNRRPTGDESGIGPGSAISGAAST